MYKAISLTFRKSDELLTKVSEHKVGQTKFP